MGCFLKSQKQRCPVECDHKLLVLWNKWEDAFPGKSFNKFHGLFCTIRNFMHKYEMAGRISEESNEGSNGILADTKERLRCMPSDKERIHLTSVRTQGNLNGNILEEKLAIGASIQGKRRGPQKDKVQMADERSVVGGSGGSVMLRGDTYLRLQNGNLMWDRWIDIYEWFDGGLAPKAWREALNSTVPGNFTEMDKMKETMT